MNKLIKILSILLMLTFLMGSASAACSSGTCATTSSCSGSSCSKCTCVPTFTQSICSGKLCLKDTTTCAHSKNMWYVNGKYYSYSGTNGRVLSIPYVKGTRYTAYLRVYDPGCGKNVWSKTVSFTVK